MFSLTYVDAHGPRRHTLKEGETLVGRSAGCDVVIDDGSVSRRQAKIIVEGPRCRLIDLNSTNYTTVNGTLVTETELKDGDAILFGSVPVQFLASEEERVALTEDHEIIESSGTVYRSLKAENAPKTQMVTVDGRRLLSMMSDISRTLVRPQPLVSVFNKVVDIAFDAIAAERAFLVLRDQSTAEMVPRVARNRDGSPPANTTLSRTVLTRVMTERIAILARDVRLDPALAGAASIHTGNIRSFLCAPLWSQEEVIGAFYLDNPHSHEFTEPDLDLFVALSDYAAVAIEQARLAARIQEELRHRERLQRYHSPAVVDRILADEGDAASVLAAQERDVSVLFCDLVGFTTMSERMGPTSVARILNRYFEKMADAVFEHQGTLDKFIGDAVMAVFGAPMEQSDHAIRAVRAAVAMRQKLAQLNHENPTEPLDVRIAVNSGIATAGDIGSLKRREYTVLGDVVNTCARIQSYACAPGQIVITSATSARLDGAIPTRSLGSQKLRGREALVEIFEVLPEAMT
jgi:adenylate cyclase